MAWSWSHTNEAYLYVRSQIEEQNRAWLEVVYAEWEAAEGDIDFHAEFNEEKYSLAIEDAKGMSDYELIERIWERTEGFSRCTNGGHFAWCCPFGCTPHMLPFSPE